MRKFFVPLLIFMFLATASAQVSYSIDTGIDQAKINTTIKLNCQREDPNCPVNRWRLSWGLPEGAEIISIRDSLGKIEEENYEVEGTGVKINTTKTEDRKRTSETVKIWMKIEEDAEEIYRGLYKRSFYLAGFSGEKTSGTLHNDNMLSGWTSHGFKTAYSEEYLNFTGEGSVNIRTKFGEGQETEYYEFFGGSPPENTELAYEVSVATTGLVQEFEKFPVASMDSETFNETVARWSTGEYIGGSMKIRKTLEKNDFLAVLAHETVHGLNDRVLNWDRTKSSYIEEGVGKYVEFLMNRKLEGADRVRELFGDPVKYEEERNGKTYVITLPAAGSRERLWNYYQQDKEFMKTWNPMNYPDKRTFGYAYSQLIIRNYIARMNGSVSDLYRKVQPLETVNSAEEKWSLYSDFMDMTPCKYENKDKFKKCLEKINSYDYEVLRATKINRGEKSLHVEQIEVPNHSEKEKLDILPGIKVNKTDVGTEEPRNREKGIGAFLEWLGSNFQEFFASLRGGF